MKFGRFTHRRMNRPAQDGYILLWILLMMFFMSLALMAAATSVVQQMRREQEEEMIHRGVQYARAIKKYVMKVHTYPATVEQLENTNNVRFLRQRYKDPMSPNGEWHLIRYGEVQMGQTGVAGIGGMQGSPAGVGSSTGGIGTFGSPGGAAGLGQSDTTGQAGSSTPSTSAFSGPAQGGSSTQSTSAFSGPATQSSGTSQVFGGGAIIGVSSTSEKQGIHEFNGKSHYNQWQFIYDPTFDRGGLITGPYQPLKQLMPGAQMPGSPQQPGSSVMK